MEKLYDRYPGEAQPGKDIVIGASNSEELFLSDTGGVYCYAGICLKDAQRQRELMWPWYMQGKHSTDRKIAKEIRGFFRLTEGRILLDDYVDAQPGEHMYKRINVGIRFPAADTYYSVWVDREEDEFLTRAVFGLTCAELHEVLESYAKVLGAYNDYVQYPPQDALLR